MTSQPKITCYGVRSVKTRQADATPSSVPRLGSSPSATVGQAEPSWGARRRRGNATGQASKSKPLVVMHWNAEGVFRKEDELQNLLLEKGIDICCIQETHLKEGKNFKIRGYQKPFRLDRPDRPKGGVLTLIRNNLHAIELSTHLDGAEYQYLKVRSNCSEINLINYYCPNDRPLSLNSIDVPVNNFLMVGDFNSHSQSWGYNHTDSRGEELEDWQDDNKLILVNDPDDPPSFFHRGWRTCSTPDLAFCSEDVHRGIKREVGNQLGGSDHKPVFITIENNVVSIDSPRPRWNYKKAKWTLFSIRANELTRDIRVQGRNENCIVKEWTQGILKAAKETIPKGARRDYKPFWSDEIKALEDDLNVAREEAEKDASQESAIRLQCAKAKFLKAKVEAKRRSWREKTSSLNMEKDSKALWKLAKSLNEEDSRGSTITLDEGGILTGKQAADCFAKTYGKESDIKVSPEQRRKARCEQQERAKRESNDDSMMLPLTLQELNTALRKLKKKKSPGPDGITNEMLTHLDTTARLKLLEIFNLSWEEGRVPQMWKEATMIPILKKGKVKTKSSSYRPISLTSCVVKVMERIVNRRLMGYLEAGNIISEEQAGFRQFRSTEDQVTYLSQEIEDAFQEKKVLFATWIDLQKAFDKVWTDGLLVKAQRCGVGGKMFRWIKSLLQNRKARVSVDGKYSRKFLLRHGVPQGGVVSPTLFLIFIDDLLTKLPKGIKTALYADDLVMWCTEEYATTATYRMQQAVDILTTWAKEWNVSINKEKSSTTLFTLTKQKAGTITLEDQNLRQDDEPTYLGVTFDKKQTWKPHIQTAETKAKRKLAILRKLAGTTWGANEKTLRTVYEGTIRPHLEYGAAAWSSASKTTLQTVDKVQNQALRLITGAMKTTPISKMEEVTGIQPLQDRRNMKTLLQAEKFKCQVKHPMKAKVEGRTRNRLKRGSFLHQVKKLEREHISHLPEKTIPPVLDISKPWMEPFPVNMTICTSIPHLYSSDMQADTVRCNVTRAHCEDLYPQEAWIQAFTDGSATKAVSDGGAGVYIKFPDGTTVTRSTSTGMHCSNYKAEVKALILAVEMIKDNSWRECRQVVFQTDALSVLEALVKGGERELAESLNTLAETHRVALQWIPAHCGIPGNETADKLAKEGAKSIQFEEDLSYVEKRNLIKSTFRKSRERDEYHFLSRQEQVVLFRLRTGHNRLNYHMSHKLKLVPSTACNCQQGDQTAEHILQACHKLNAFRDSIWPSATHLKTKLYGPKEELEKTGRFVRLANIVV